MAQKFEYNVNKSTWSMTHLLLEPGIPGIFKVTRYASGKLNFACKLDYIPLCNVQELFFLLRCNLLYKILTFCLYS